MTRIVLEPEDDSFDALLNALTWKLAKGLEPLDKLRFLSGLSEAVDHDINLFARAAAGETTWQEVGDALGISRQAAHKRFSV